MRCWCSLSSNCKMKQQYAHVRTLLLWSVCFGHSSTITPHGAHLTKKYRKSSNIKCESARVCDHPPDDMPCSVPVHKKECNVRGIFRHTDSSSERRRSRSGACRGSHVRDGRGRNRATKHTYTCLMLCEKFMHNRLVVPITAHPRDCRTAWPNCSRHQ